MSFKFFKENSNKVVYLSPGIYHSNELIQIQEWTNGWYYQFDDDEPIFMGSISQQEMVFTLTPNSSLTFAGDSRRFKMFLRPHHEQ